MFRRLPRLKSTRRPAREGALITSLLIALGFLLPMSLAGPAPQDQTAPPPGLTGTPSGTSRPITPGPGAAPVFLTTPRATDLSPGGFRVSFVADQPVTGTLEVSQNPDLSSPLVFSDNAAHASGAVLLVSFGLSNPTEYYWRVKATNLATQSVYWPPTSPYPSLFTKESADTSINNNPLLDIGAFKDGNANWLFDGEPTDTKQLYFLVHLEFPGTEPMASRGGVADASGWLARTSTQLLRNDDPVGDYHPLPGGATLSIKVHGRFDGGAGYLLWENLTAQFVLCTPWPACSPGTNQEEYPTSVPEGVGWVVEAVVAVALLAGVLRGRAGGKPAGS